MEGSLAELFDLLQDSNVEESVRLFQNCEYGTGNTGVQTADPSEDFTNLDDSNNAPSAANPIMELSPVHRITFDPKNPCHDFSTFRRESQPCLIEGFVSTEDWPALQKWQDVEYIKSLLDELVVVHLPTSENRQRSEFVDKQCQTESLPWDEVISAIFEPPQKQNPQTMQRLYVKCGLRPQFKKDIMALPNACFGLEGIDRIKEQLTKVWAGSAGNVTPLHFDLCHGVLSQVVGRKRVYLFPISSSDYLYPNSATSNFSPRTSKIDFTALIRGCTNQNGSFPRVSEAPGGLVVDINPGECLYIPPFWWHCVEALEPNVSVIMPFDLSTDEQHNTKRPWTLPEWGNSE